MIIDNLFSSPEGDIHLGPEDLNRSFLLTPTRKHTFITLKDYFVAIERFILTEEGASLINIMETRGAREISLAQIKRILIRSEKHGSSCHVSSVEVFCIDFHIKLCVLTAIHQKAKEDMAVEFDLTKYLEKVYGLPCIPKVFYMKNINIITEKGEENLCMTCAEWLDDFIYFLPGCRYRA